jgi:hypothetical protein
LLSLAILQTSQQPEREPLAPGGQPPLVGGWRYEPLSI